MKAGNFGFKMIKSIIDIIANTDIWTAIFTLSVVILASAKNWLVAEGNLIPSYWLMIALGIGQICLNTYLASENKGQEVLILLNFVAVWIALMGIKGLRRIKKENG